MYPVAHLRPINMYREVPSFNLPGYFTSISSVNKIGCFSLGYDFGGAMVGLLVGFAITGAMVGFLAGFVIALTTQELVITSTYPKKL